MREALLSVLSERKEGYSLLKTQYVLVYFEPHVLKDVFKDKKDRSVKAKTIKRPGDKLFQEDKSNVKV